MFSLLSVIPILGPIIQGVVDVFNKQADISLQKQADTNKTELGKIQDKNKTDVAIIQTRAQVAIAFKDDLGVRLVRDLVMFPVGVWTACYYYTLTFPNYSWHVTTPPDAMQYIPYAIIAFLFATSYRGNQ